MLKQSLILTAVICCLVLTALPAGAGEMSGGGQNMFMPKVMSSMELADGTVANRMLFKGFMTDETEGSPLAVASMQCAGTTIVGKVCNIDILLLVENPNLSVTLVVV